MRKLCIFLIAVLCFSGTALAQQQAAKKNYTGVRAGLNLSTFSGDTEDLGMQVGAHGDFYALYMESKRIGLQPEIQYSLQGTKTENGGHLLMHYVVVPLMLKVFPAPAFSIQAGPDAGFLFSSKYEREAVGIVDNRSKGQDFGLRPFAGE